MRVSKQYPPGVLFNRRNRWRNRIMVFVVSTSFTNPQRQPLRGLNEERCLQH